MWILIPSTGKWFGESTKQLYCVVSSLEAKVGLPCPSDPPAQGLRKWDRGSRELRVGEREAGEMSRETVRRLHPTSQQATGQTAKTELPPTASRPAARPGPHHLGFGYELSAKGAVRSVAFCSTSLISDSFSVKCVCVWGGGVEKRESPHDHQP